MKIERLLAITNYLLSNKRVTAQTLSVRFNVSTRTIMRDINTLSLAGIPVVTYYGADGGYEILDSFKLDRQLVGENQFSYIVTALQGLQTAFDNNELNETLEKMQAIAPENTADMVLDFGVLKENNNTNEKLLLLQRAIHIRQRIIFSYTNADNEEKDHEVEPVATMYKWYNWYLLCYYPKYEDYRIFKLVRMRALSITGQMNSKVHSVGEAKRKWEQSEYKQKIIRVRLLCKRSIKAKCEEYLNGKIIEEFDTGEFLYEINVPENEHFWYGTVLAFGNQAKVIEPPDLIERICLNCNEILKQYKEV
ncbi:helix-turn-helix transcriptional regulator [Konateibacter massiliensis]|uniref:helix-turn-helix transcriptional regulator n=1 Tax=Konateibacter massiliensis TaxID=2002841 RepID=UPI000C1505B7|nr:YafY family protein [Konateibacter massiliensis]